MKGMAPKEPSRSPGDPMLGFETAYSSNVEEKLSEKLLEWCPAIGHECAEQAQRER